MFRAVGLFVCVFVVLAAGDQESSEKCHKFKRNVMKCCAKPSKPRTGPKPEIKECLTEQPSLNCEREICVAKKLGYYRSDDKIDMEALRNYIEKDLEDNQEILSMVKKNCLNTEPTDVCGYKQIHHCILKQSIDSCQEWKTEEPCDENIIKELTEVCLGNY